MIDMKSLNARRKPGVGDHVDYIGDFGSAYVGLIVDVAENGDMIVAKPGAKDSLFDPRSLRVSKDPDL